MPDIQTALQTALSKAQPAIPPTWDDEGDAPIETVATTEGKQFFSVTTNVTRSTFNYVRNNPGKTRAEVVDALGAIGFNPSSTTSLVAQFIKQGQFAERNGYLFAQNDEYRPLKTSTTKPKKQPEKAKYSDTISDGGVDPRSAPAPQINSAWDTETLLNTLSIKQARALYDELKKIFGG